MRALVFTYTRNTMLDTYRYARRHKEELDPDVGMTPDTSKDAAPSAESEALTLSLEKRLGATSDFHIRPIYKDILLAVYRDGKQLNEYARETGVNENTMRQYHSRALRAVEKLAGVRPDMDEHEKRGIVADFLGLQDSDD